MNVLSLFDGMSCGQIALSELGMFPDKYYACEIDKFAIAQTKLNFPDTICLGDVTKLDVSKLEKIDLLIGGSPCQSFSFAGKMEGMTTEDNEEITTLDRYLELKEKGFKFAGQSYLFWEYVRILKEVRKVNPNVLFLLENVRMLSKWEDVINRTLGVKGVHINSALVSAQIRKRIYWTNIADIPQPEDKRIFLRDILQSGVPEKYYLSDKTITRLTRHEAKKGITAENVKSSDVENIDIPKLEGYLKGLLPRVRGLSVTKNGIRPHRGDEKKSGLGELKTILFETSEKTGVLLTSASSAPALISKDYTNWMGDYVCVAMRGRNPDNPSDRRTGSPTEQRLEPNTSGKTNCLTTVQKDNLIAGFARVRRLTPTECARLQTIPDWYKWECSDTQQYRMLGNGWTVAVIYHIFSFIK